MFHTDNLNWVLHYECHTVSQSLRNFDSHTVRCSFWFRVDLLINLSIDWSSFIHKKSKQWLEYVNGGQNCLCKFQKLNLDWDCTQHKNIYCGTTIEHSMINAQSGKDPMLHLIQTGEITTYQLLILDVGLLTALATFTSYCVEI